MRNLQMAKTKWQRFFFNQHLLFLPLFHDITLTESKTTYSDKHKNDKDKSTWEQYKLLIECNYHCKNLQDKKWK